MVEPLQTLLTEAMTKAKSKKSRAVAPVPLSEWAEMHDEAVKLAHPKAEYVMCLFTDASSDHWSGMLTQVSRDEYNATTDVQQWPHEPLGFVGGTFRGSALTGPSQIRRVSQFASPVLNLLTCLYTTVDS